jgi:hypothetical protein
MKEGSMHKASTALAALFAVWAFSSAATASERHKEHTASTTALEALVTPPPVAPRPVAEDETVLPQSKPATATNTFKAYGGGCLKRQDQTVYLTQ